MKNIFIADDQMKNRNALKAILVAEYFKTHKVQAGDAPAILRNLMDEDWNAGIDTAMNEFIHAVNRFLPTRDYLPEPLKKLTIREYKIAQMLASGISLSKVAEKLSLEFTCVSAYRSRIMEKLQLKTTVGLTLYAIKHKMIWAGGFMIFIRKALILSLFVYLKLQWANETATIK